MVAIGGDGLLRPLAAALRGREAALALVPCGRGNDLARVLGGRRRTPPRRRALAAEGDERLVDVADVDGTPFMGIASLGFDSDANRIANEAELIRGDAVYAYAALRALAFWRPARFTVTVDAERHELIGYSVAVGNSVPTAAACSSPTPSSTTASSTSCSPSAFEAALPAQPPQGLQGHPSGFALRALAARSRWSR